MDKRRMNTDSSQTTKIRIRNSTQSILGGKYYPHTKIKERHHKNRKLQIIFLMKMEVKLLKK